MKPILVAIWFLHRVNLLVVGHPPQGSCVIFASFLIPMSWISVNFYLRIIFHQWKMMEDDGRRWKMTNGHLKMYSRVLCYLWIVFNTHELSFCEFLFEDHLPSMEDDGRRWKMMEDDGKWWKMYCHIIYNTFDIL